MSNYIGTYSGKKVYMPNPDPASIDIEDIARALSYAARFAGHTSEHWSVAQHSICVAELVPKPYRLQALLHDATEAYLCDIPTPFKLMLPEYKAMEDELWVAIATKFNVPVEMAPVVKEADRIMLMTERDMLRNNGEDWGPHYEDTVRIPWIAENYAGWHPDMVRKEFLDRFKGYGGVA